MILANREQQMDNSVKLAIYRTQDEYNENKNTTQYVLDTTMRKQKQITEIKHKQLEVKTNRTSFLFGHRNRHHDTELTKG